MLGLGKEIVIPLIVFFYKKGIGILVGKERVESLKERSEMLVSKGEKSVVIR
jgi:hypothetical protein